MPSQGAVRVHSFAVLASGVTGAAALTKQASALQRGVRAEEKGCKSAGRHEVSLLSDAPASSGARSPKLSTLNLSSCVDHL